MDFRDGINCSNMKIRSKCEEIYSQSEGEFLRVFWGGLNVHKSEH